LTAEPCRKPKTDNQQMLRNNLKLKLKYEVNLRDETQIKVLGPDLKMKNSNTVTESADFGFIPLF
jgi:hypothetical protein